MRKVAEIAAAAAIVAAVYVVLGCPIKLVTGISCLGCGMSRAVVCVLRGDAEAALEYHPLVFALPVFAVTLAVLRRRRRGRRVAVCVIAAIFLVVYVARLLDPSDSVVVFRPQDGIFAIIIKEFL